MMNKLNVIAILIMSSLFFYGCTYLGFGSIDTEYLLEKYTDKNSRVFTFDGVKFKDVHVHYNVAGQGEPIVLLHGFMASLHAWDGWMQALTDNYSVYRIDLPGFGLSGSLPDNSSDYTIEDYMLMLDKFYEVTGLDAAHVVGNSLGGYTAWNYAVRHPSRVKSMTLIDPVSHPQNIPWPIVLGSNALTSPFAKLMAPKYLFSAALREVYGDNKRLTKETVTLYHEMAMRKGNKKNFVTISKIFKDQSKNAQLGEQFKHVAVPTLLMWGERDKWVPLEHAYLLKDLVPNAQLIVYPTAGHVPHEEIPARTVADFKQFIQSQ